MYNWLPLYWYIVYFVENISNVEGAHKVQNHLLEKAKHTKDDLKKKDV